MSSVSPSAMSLPSVLFEDARGAPPDLRTLVEVSRRRALTTPDQLAYTFLLDGETAEAHFTFRELDLRARAIAAHLQARGAEGERVLLVFDPGLDYIASIFGCFYAGAVAAPAYPPDPFRLARTLPRLRAVVKDSEAKFLMSTRPVLGEPGGLLWEICGAGTIVSEEISNEEAAGWKAPSRDPQKIALLQYTSGSTGDPRGVTLTHANLMHNFGAGFHLMDVPDAVGVHWLPPYHDMGLIGGILLPLYAGRRTVLMSPLAFMQRPLRWLEAIHRYRGTTTGGPNFSYDLCVRKIKDEECEGLDLSSWQVAVNGAEPVRADTLHRFAEKFAPYGFRPETLMPAYGMAETTLIISATPIPAAPAVNTFHGPALEANRAEVVPEADPHARKLTGCGPPALDMNVRIVDPQTLRRLPEGRAGEIWVRSPSVGQGYWNRPEETKHTFRARLPGDGGGPYLRTGDLGFLYEGDLYVVGRLKELIILGGRNFYPHDLERAVQDAHPALKPDGGAAFSVDVDDEERLVLVQEVLRPRRFDLDEVIAAIRRSLAESFDLAAHAIVLIPSGSLPKTSSGKTRRRQCREDFLADRLNQLRSWRAEREGSPAAEALDPPATKVEEQLAELWREVLGVEDLGRRSDFFALGAQSLRATQLAARIAAEFGAAIPLRRLFDDPTLAGMAVAIEEALDAGKGRPRESALAPISRTEGAGPHPLSFSQQRLWFLEQMGQGGRAAHVPLILRLSGPMDGAALEAALGDLAGRHEMLRARVFEQDGSPVQEIVPQVPIPLERIDLSRLTEVERSSRLEETQAHLIGRPFDLAAAPPLRASLIRVGEQEFVLSLVMHHIVCDGWSAEILLRDLASAYAALRKGASPAWGDAAVRYVDFARWQRDHLAEEKLGTDLGWWRRRLEGAPQMLDLPTDRSRSSAAPSQPAAESRPLPQSLLASLEKLARQEGATPFMVHLAAFQAVLSRYAGREDLCVGTAVAGRSRPEVENTVGCFINTVPLRGDLSGDPAFRDLLRRTRSAALEDFEHSEAPFEKIVEAIQPERHPGAAPLVQAMFLYQTPQRAVSRLGEAAVVSAGSDYSGLAVFDVTLVIEPRGEETAASLVYDRRLFDGATIAAMLDSYLAVLEQVAADPETRLSDLPVPSAAERKLLLEEWNATDRPAPRVAGFHELFERQAKKTPGAPAIDFGETAWTYRELNEQADRIAAALRRCGVGANTPVGVHLSRRPELVATLLAVVKAAGAYVPLDPEYPAARLAFMVADCGMPVLVTEAALAASLPETQARVVTLESLLQGSLDERVDSAHRRNGHGRPPLAEERLAYVIYTSGSTGAPKGVMVPQRAVVNFLASMATAPGLSAADAMLAATTVSFDIAVLELFLPLTVGAKVVLADRETAIDGRRLAGLIDNRRITAMQGTPATYRMLLSAGWKPRPGMKLLVGGEALSGDLATELLAGDVELWNMYGPTETTVWSATHRVARGEDPIPIGRPIANTQLYILDAQGRLAPHGAVGELCIGGVGVAAGYWNRCELTAERFIENRIADARGGRLYRTGDLARWRSDGTLEFLGRADTQVKVRGFRIELGEIEAALSAHPQIREAAVIAPADGSGERRLVAYFAPRNGAAPGPEELRRRLSESLPPYMTPAAFIELPEIPHTPAGKIDRGSLPAPDGEAFSTSARFVAPRTPLEEEIAAAWRDVLGLERVGVEDSFFELGGHSLLAARLFSRLRDQLHVELPLREFYERPTIAAAAEAIVRVRAAEAGGRMDELLDRLEGMSDEEAAALLKEMEENA